MKKRIAARVLVEEKSKILFSKCKDERGIFYTLPGGGIEKTELAKEAAFRECLEETGYKIKVGELVLVKEFIKKIPIVEAWKNGIHQIELIFKCKLDKSFEKEIPKHQDVYQISLEWLAISELHKHRIYPTNNLEQYLKKDCKEPRYIGLNEF